jgi:hypothetical protein
MTAEVIDLQKVRLARRYELQAAIEEDDARADAWQRLARRALAGSRLAGGGHLPGKTAATPTDGPISQIG